MESIITVYGALSATTNRLVEIVGKPIVRKIADQLGLSDEAYNLLMKLTSVLLGIIQAIMWNVNFFAGYPSLSPVAGYVLSGLSVGLGAEFADAFIDFFYAGSTTKPDLDPNNGVVVAPEAKTVNVDVNQTVASTDVGSLPLNG
mgnify:CR=1 FL=1